MKNKFVLYFFLIVSLQLFAQNETYEVFNTSINSRFAELGISYLNDSTVIYASSKKTANDKSFIVDRRKNNRQLYVDLYSGKIKNGDITNEQKFTQEVDNKFYVSDISFTKDQKSVFFTWNNFYNTASRKDSAKWKTLHIVKASITKDLDILSIEHLPFNSEDYSVRSPELSKDESQLFFISDMPGGYGNTDIYVVDIFKNGTYSEPRNLGSNVNTKLPEMFPHAAENGNLYFSSYGHNSTGGLDIFKSNLKNGNYEKAQKLPDPINTRVDDFAFVINETDNSGFFSSTRKKGKGDADIYSFIRIPLEIKCEKEISGNILDINSKEQLSNVHIQLLAEGEIKDDVTTGNDGYYSFKLDCELDYKLEVSKQYYEDKELFFITNIDFEDKTTENILLTPKDCLQTLNLEIVHQETDEILNDVSLKLFKNIDEINLDKIKAIDIDCNSRYKIVAEKSGFISNTISFVSSKEYNEILSKKIALTPIKCYQNFTGTIVDKITQQELNDLKVSLIENDVIIDEIDLESFKLNFTLDCNQKFKIKVEKTNYKTTEFDVSTTNELKKVIFETIELEPLECNQTISVIVVDVFKEPLSGALIQLYKNNEVFNTIESSNKKLTLEFDCENTYKIVVSKENYTSQEYGFTTSRQYDLGLTKQFELVEKDCNQTISGIITNSESGENILTAKVTLFRGNNLIQTIFTNENSTFNLDINCNTNYKILVEKDGFNSSEYEFSTDEEFDNSLTKNILLEPSKCDQTIVLTSINATSKEELNGANISLFDIDKLIETKISSGETIFNLVCEKSYKIVVTKENFITKEYVFNTNSAHKNSLKETIELVEKECLQTISGIITDSGKKSIIPNVKVSLFTDSNLLNTTFTNEKGEFNLQLNCNSDYRIVVEKAEFQTFKNDLNTDGKFNKKQTKNILLEALKCNQSIVITSINTTSKEVLNGANISLYDNDKLIETKISSGETLFNLVCEKSYKIVVTKENFITKEYVFNTNSVHENSLKETLELVEKECLQTISGIITDSEKKSIIPNVKVSLFSDSNLLNTTFTNEKGEFNLQLNCNSDYRIVVEKAEFQTLENDLNTDEEFNKSQTKNFSLAPLKCDQTIVLTSINATSKEVLYGANISLYDNDKLIETKISSGETLFHLVCEKPYKIVVSKENFITKEYVFNTNNIRQNNLIETIELVEKECLQTLSGIITDSEKNLILSNAKVSLFTNNDLLNSTFTNEKGAYKFQLICNTNYKIVVEKTDFETEEFELKLNKEFNATLSKNINLKPIPCNQIIFGILINDKNQEVIANATVKLFSNGNLISEIQTDTEGTYSFNIECKKTYKITGQHENYFLSETSFSSDKLADKTISKNIELSPKICSQSLNIIIANEETNEQLSNLELTLTKNGKHIESISLKTKNLVLNIECNSTYKIAISKENYKSKEVEFSSNSEFYKKNSEFIKLQPLPCKQYISGKVFDKKLGNTIENTTIEVYSNNNLISTHKTEQNGDFSIELDCNLDYKIVTSAKDYLNDLKIINTTNQYDKEFKLDIYLNDKESELFEEIENVRTVKMNPINFALNESKITNSIAQELDKLIVTLAKYPNLNLEVKNHTDSRAPDDYNLKLSEDRASSIINYIISNGIESSRVSGKGYGETELLNKCSNGVKCSEAEHQLNRRTAFIVTEKQ